MKQHEMMSKYLSGLCRGIAHSLIVKSSAGMGKTELVMNTMNKLGYKEHINYRYVSNYITPVELYNLLDEVSQLKAPKMLIMDDCEVALQDKKIIGILRSALWPTPDGKRKVCWTSGSNRIKKKEIYFEGAIVILLNHLNTKSPIVNAFKDRGFYFEPTLSKEDMLALMEERVKIGYKGISYEKRKEIFDFIKKVGRIESMTLRLLPKAYNSFLVSPNHWRELVMEII